MGKNGDISKNGKLVYRKVKILVERWNSKVSKKPPVLKTFGGVYQNWIFIVKFQKVRY
jgi:hypothetical protein